MAKKATAKAGFTWNKGPKTKTVTLGGAKLTVRGLTYREVLHCSPMDKADGDILTLRLAVVAVDNLMIDGEPYTAQYEDYEYMGRTVRALTDQSFDELFESNLQLVSELLDMVVELTGVTVVEGKAVRLFRP